MGSMPLTVTFISKQELYSKTKNKINYAYFSKYADQTFNLHTVYIDNEINNQKQFWIYLEDIIPGCFIDMFTEESKRNILKFILKFKLSDKVVIHE